MNITQQLRKAASADLFSLKASSDSFVGHPFYFDYDIVHVLVADARKKKVGGIPQGAFLLAFYDNEESEKEAILLRALGPTKLPTDQEVIQSMIEYYKDNLRVSGQASQLDEFTRYEFSFSGLECRVLGTFYEDSTGRLVFGADLENFYSSHNYSVYKPSGRILEKIVNFRGGDNIPGQEMDVRIGIVRYSSSRRFQESEDGRVPFYVSPADFLGKRTALFGMTRTGKSNTVKKIIQATIEVSDLATSTLQQEGVSPSPNVPLNPLADNGKPSFPVGQIIFDINGEYANANLQDEGTALFEMYKTRVARFSVLDKTGFKVMKTNFYEDVSAGFEMLRSLLNDDTTRFVEGFRTVDLEFPADKQGDFAFKTRYDRRLAAYKCCLHLAGFNHGPDQRMIFQGEAKVNSLSNIDPSKGISFDEAVTWFSVIWDEIGDNNPIFSEYRTTKGRDWAEDDLKALMVMMTRKRTGGKKRTADCAGFRVLKSASELHTSSIDKPFSEEILQYAREGKVVIADLSQGAPEVIRIYSEKICHRIFEDSMARFIQNQSNNFIQIYFEEAHNLFPKKEDKDLSQIYNRLAKEGAKLNIGIVYATQEVSSISSNILKNTQNWFIAHLNNVDEIREVEKYYDYEDFSKGLGRFSASTDKGFIRIKTYSNSFTVPTQVDRFVVSREP